MNDVYEKNLKAIEEAYPELHKWIIDTPDVTWIKCPSINKLYVAIGTKLIPAYSGEDHIENSKDVLNYVKPLKHNISVLIGIGQGHATNHIFNKAEKGHQLIVIEPIAHMVRTAFKRYDFSKPIKNRELIICAPGKAEIAWVLEAISNQKIVEDWFVVIEHYTKQLIEYNELTLFTAEILNQIRCNIGTISGDAGAKIADNDIATLPWIIRHRGVNELKDLFKGKPVITVSTGPSLSRNIHLLRKAYHGAIIVAVGQALRPLLAYDIQPDFICTVDFGEVNMAHYRGLLDSGIPLVALNRTYAPLLKSYKGPKFISAVVSEDSEGKTHSILKDKGALNQGGSVAHMAFSLAVHIGGDPIIMIGQDFALTEDSHMKQVDARGHVQKDENGILQWRVDDPRCSLYSKDISKKHSMGPEQQVPGYYGTPVNTNVGLAAFITSMESMIEFSGRKVINATEGGACIRGAEPIFLQEAIDKYIKDSIRSLHNARMTEISDLCSLLPDADKLIEDVIPLLENDIDILKQIKISCNETFIANTKIKQAMKKGNAKLLQQRIIENDNLSKQTRELSSKIPAVGIAIHGAVRRIGGRELSSTEKRKLPVKKLMRNENISELTNGLKRNRIIIEAAKKASTDLLETYINTHSILDNYNRTKDQTILEPIGDTAPDIDDADEYFNAGNFARPYLEAKRILSDQYCRSDILRQKASAVINRAIAMREDEIEKAITQHNEDIKQGKDKLAMYFHLQEKGQVYGRKKNFEKALEYLEKAVDLLPDREEARWGCASASIFLNQLDDAVKIYEALIKDFPDNLRYPFELGQLLIRQNKIDEGLKKLSIVFEQTEKYDSFLPTVGGIYMRTNDPEKALLAYDTYLEKWPMDYAVLDKKAECLASTGDVLGAKRARTEANKLKGL